MKIKLDDKHYLNSDQWSYWITCKTKGDKAKKSYERRVSGYCTTFVGAVESFIDDRIATSTATSVTALKKDIVKLKKEVRAWESKKPSTQSQS